VIIQLQKEFKPVFVFIFFDSIRILKPAVVSLATDLEKVGWPVLSLLKKTFAGLAVLLEKFFGPPPFLDPMENRITVSFVDSI
jgi:hypothetical protein